MLVGAGLVYGALVFVVSAFIGLRFAAAIFNSGDQITHMAKMPAGASSSSSTSSTAWRSAWS
jgi:hypothetical protein